MAVGDQINFPGLSASTPITADGARPSQLFQLWFNGLLNGISGILTQNTNQIALIQQQQAQITALIQTLQSAQAVATQAQATADTGGPAQSGTDQHDISISGTSWVSVATVNLTGVVAGSLTIFGSGPQQEVGTSIAPMGVYTGAYRIVENPGAVVVYSGTFTAQSFYDAEFGATIFYLYVNDDQSQVSIPRTTTGAISYSLEVQGVAGATFSNVMAYLYVRRS